jgi:hypothetical protein
MNGGGIWVPYLLFCELQINVYQLCLLTLHDGFGGAKDNWCCGFY